MQFPSSRLLPAILALAVGSGCSFTFIDTVPDDPERRQYFDCTSTYGLPVADGVFALSGVVSAVTTLSQSKDEFEDENDGANRDVVAGVSIAQAAVFVASGIYGVIQTEQCASAKSALRARLMPRAARRKTQVLPPPPPPGPAVPAPPSPPPSQPPLLELPPQPDATQPPATPAPEADPVQPAPPSPPPAVTPAPPPSAAPPAVPPQSP